MHGPFGSWRRKRRPNINITPLIDVMFLLLIFFMVSSTFRERLGIDIALPEAQSAREQELEPHEITVGPEGELFFGEADYWYAAPSLTDDGYLIEFRFLKEGVMDNLAADIIGFNIAINEDDNDEVADDRDMQLMWNGPAHRESCYGALLLGGPPTGIGEWEFY